MVLVAATLGLASAGLDWISHPVEAGDWVMISGDFRGGRGGKFVTLKSRKNVSATFRASVAEQSNSSSMFQMPSAAAIADVNAGLVFDVSVDGSNESIAASVRGRRERTI